jgi:formylglycine-generating enzyme required for sulfatase activity
MRKLYLAAALGFTLASFAACFPSLEMFEDGSNTNAAGANGPSGPGSGAGRGNGGSGAGTSEGTGAASNAGGSGGQGTAPDGGPLDYCQLSTKQLPPEAIENPGLPAHTRCIDTTEVSFAQYQVFLDWAGDQFQYHPGNTNKYQIGAENSDCSYKDGKAGGDHPYRPDDNNWTPYDANRSGLADRPVEGVDWCDAWAYCHHADKELCGDASGAKIDRDDAGVWATETEWYDACHQFEPWPVTPQCYSAVTDAGDVRDSLDVDSGCVGSDTTPLEHMTSNVWEWENNCTKVAGSDRGLDDCRYRGDPNLGAGNVPSACSWWNNLDATSPRNAGGQGDHIGIRCCWDVHKQ